MGVKIFVHVALFNSCRVHGVACVETTIRSLLNQDPVGDNGEFEIVIRDNGSNDESLRLLKERLPGAHVRWEQVEYNLGFSGVQNLAAREFLDSDCDYLAIVNPDIRFQTDALRLLVEGLERYEEAGCACPKLLRGDNDLQPHPEGLLDAAGMYMTPDLRHLDRGSGQPDSSEYAAPCFVFGGSGACLVLRRSFVEDAALCADHFEEDLGRVYPELLRERENRHQLFDEAFFAYREDADFAWRCQLLGWRCVYVPAAIGYHERVVLPERRRALPAEINRNSVRNRYLMQVNNYTLSCGVRTFLLGILVRNLVVMIAVVILERRSFGGLLDVAKLFRRALARRRALMKRVDETRRTAIGQWFASTPFVEKIE